MKKTQEGMTTLELMIAVLVIAIAILSLGFLMRETGVVSRRIKDKDAGYALLNKQMERLRSTIYADLVSGDTFWIVPGNPPYTIRVIVTDQGPAGRVTDFKKLVVSVHWPRWGSNDMMGETITTYAGWKGLNP